MTKTIFTTKEKNKWWETIFTTWSSPKKEEQEVFTTKDFPEAIWPYSPSYKAWKTYYFSWQIGINPKTKKLVKWWIEFQTTQVIKNISWVLAKNKLEFKDIVKTTIFLKNINDFAIVNEIYAKYFSHKPARSTVEVSNLPLWALIEIEVIARKS